jgi:hypothetical protein
MKTLFLTLCLFGFGASEAAANCYGDYAVQNIVVRQRIRQQRVQRIRRERIVVRQNVVVAQPVVAVQQVQAVYAQPVVVQQYAVPQQVFVQPQVQQYIAPQLQLQGGCAQGFCNGMF